MWRAPNTLPGVKDCPSVAELIAAYFGAYTWRIGSMIDSGGRTEVNEIMSAAKEEVEGLLDKLPDNCSIEDIQYHLYVMDKVRNGLEVADSQGAVAQEVVEERLGKWLIE